VQATPRGVGGRRTVVRERGWNRRSIKVKPFWTPDKRGLH